MGHCVETLPDLMSLCGVFHVQRDGGDSSKVQGNSYHHEPRRNNSQANRDARDRENASRVREVPGPRVRAVGRVVLWQGAGRGTVEQSRTDARDGAAFGTVAEIGVVTDAFRIISKRDRSGIGCLETAWNDSGVLQ